jgi:hypothetical protein
MSSGDWENFNGLGPAERNLRDPELLPKENVSSEIPSASGTSNLPSSEIHLTESVTNTACARGGAVNRPFTCILKTCPIRRMLIRAWPAF